MNGIELLVEIKKVIPSYVAIMLTAFANKEILEDMINKDLVFKVLEKPFQKDLFQSVINDANKVLQERKAKEQNINNLKNNTNFN